MPFLQDIIHKVEVAGGVRYVRYALAALTALLVIVAYNVRVAKNFGTQEAMDAAQLARNLAEGDGYSTKFVRPFSMHLVSRRTLEKAGRQESHEPADYARIREPHPDISNAPVYPLVLAGLMKVLPFHYEVMRSQPFFSSSGRPWRHQPDFLISWFNQFLFLAVVAVTFFWARRLFDATVAATAAVALFGSDILWRFSSSGLSTMLLLLICMGLVWCLTSLDQELDEPGPGAATPLALGGIAGALIGLGALTRYGFGMMIVPALLFIWLAAGARKIPAALAMAAAFAIVLVPWVIRNYDVSGTPFGTAGFALLHGAGFSGHELERSLNPDVQFGIRALVHKLLANSRLLLGSEFFVLAGGWATALFLASLLIGFRNRRIRRMRLFLLLSLGTLFVTQALGRTELSADSPLINSENYLAVLIPMVMVYAVALFYILLDQIQLPFRQLRFAAVGIFVLLLWLPLIQVMLPPRGHPLALPAYYPPAIQTAAGYFKERELMMSDVPWAVAWYGNRQCLWLTLNAVRPPDDPTNEETFFAVNDLQKTINGLYLSQQGMDVRLQSELLRGDGSWGQLILNVLLRRGRDLPAEQAVPGAFPLKAVNRAYLADRQLLLADWARW